MKKENKIPPRLHVLLARDKPCGVVIRRGPSRQTCFISWDRQKNIFTPAQWFKGRVYERRSDISPDGKYLIYFAMNGHWASQAKGAWTAISRAPWMKAISLFAKGDCWNGGGTFLTDKVYWLNDFVGHNILPKTNEVTQSKGFPFKEMYNNECLGVYYNRLQRDGWRLIEKENPFVFEKEMTKGWVLRKLAYAGHSGQGHGCYWDRHELVDSRGVVEKYPDWEWAEFDGKKLFWASRGCLYQASIGSGIKLNPAKRLYDFNNMTFENRSAPY